MINEKRVRLLQKGDENNGPVVYWMSRDQRVHDNWALLFAQKSAVEKKRPLVVVFNLVQDFLEATIRQYGFMLKGLSEVESELAEYHIPFFLISGKPEEEIPKFLKNTRASILVTDFDPLKIMDEYPVLKKMDKHEIGSEKINWGKVYKSLNVNRDIKEVDWIVPGESAAIRSFQDFIKNKLDKYYELRNDPTKNGQSNLSPYLHFGQISAQRIALETQRINGNKESEISFLEELIVRRELSDNFCYFNKKYDSFDGFHDWAKTSLNEHRKDEREFIYTNEQFEKAKTHDELWNAAQLQMVTTGKMHGYMRMYWAKKILEWSKSPEDAIKIAVYLNDKYEIDGRDPNGYTGIAWSIGGIHDRPWFDRPVYGKIRYMNRKGAEKKFDVKAYIDKYPS